LGNLTIASGKTLLAQGASTFTPSGSNDITINTNPGGTAYLIINNLAGVTGSAICAETSTNIIGTCNATSQSLQAAYDNGNTIATTNARDIAFTLTNDTTDSKFSVTTATGSTAGIEFLRADGAGAADPTQQVLIQNLDSNRALPVGLKVAGVTGGDVTVAVDLAESKLPDYIIACVGGGSNAMGAFNEFIDEKKVKLIGVEAGGEGKEGLNAVRFGGKGSVGVVEGFKSFFLQDNDGQIVKTHSISAGLDYAGVGPQLAHLRELGRVEFVDAVDTEVIEAVEFCAQNEGIIPALESAHAIAYALKLAPTLSKDKTIIVNVSGRGDKDLFILARAFKDEKFKEFLKNESK
jgi:threonine dehydratase